MTPEIWKRLYTVTEYPKKMRYRTGSYVCPICTVSSAADTR